MRRKACFSIRPYSTQKRVLMVANTRAAAEKRAELLRAGGYEVDCVTCGTAALTLGRSRTYDIVVIAAQLKSTCVTTLSSELQKLNPNATIACLADCRKPIPQIPCDRVLWMGEPMEYFLARLDALSATA